MMKRDENVQACVGEMYRYRLAVQDQLIRIKAATEAVRTEREQIERDEYELLFAPSMSQDAFRRQLEQVHHRDMALLWRLKSDGEFMLVAVYGIYTMAKAIRRVANGELNSCVQRAIAAFETAAPDAGLLRHLHTHADAYMRGEGRDAGKLPDPTESGAVAMLEEGPVYWVGGKLFVLSEIATAADRLAKAVAACTRSIETSGPEPEHPTP